MNGGRLIFDGATGRGFGISRSGAFNGFRELGLQEIIMDNNQLPKDRFIIASDVDKRDGIGIEIYRNNKLMVEIFRDDENKTRTVTIHRKNISFELMEEAITIFKREIPWDFIS